MGKSPIEESTTRIIEIKDEDVLIKRYKLRTTGRGGASIETTVPKNVLIREAKRLGLTLEEAIEKTEAVWRYNSFRGMHFSLELLEEEE